MNVRERNNWTTSELPIGQPSRFDNEPSRDSHVAHFWIVEVMRFQKDSVETSKDVLNIQGQPRYD